MYSVSIREERKRGRERACGRSDTGADVWYREREERSMYGVM